MPISTALSAWEEPSVAMTTFFIIKSSFSNLIGVNLAKTGRPALMYLKAEAVAVVMSFLGHPKRRRRIGRRHE